MPRVIIITGTPGTGKSTVADQLAKQLNYSHLDISRLVLDEKLYSRFERKRKTFIANRKRLKKRVGQILSSVDSGGVVVSTHYLDSFIPSRMVLRAFVLRLRPDKLGRRLQTRHWDTAKVRENVEAELVGVCLAEALERYGKKKVHEIDTTKKSIAMMVREMMEVARTGPSQKRVKSSIGVVDWLASFKPERQRGRIR